MKVPDRLQEMIEEGVIDDVRSKLLSGKEASVFVVERDEYLYAAKVYKARDERSFKKVASYMDGRNQTRNSRNKRAMSRKTKYGQKLTENNWREAEHNALQAAFDAGVRVPEPYLLYEEVLLMELVCDEDGAPAPRLADFALTKEVAALLHQEAFVQVRKLLGAGMIHGDLSAFNILVAAEGLTLIDMPQIIDASANQEAAELLHRDLKNLTEHLARFDPELQRVADCGKALWRHYQAGTLERAVKPEGLGQKRRGRPRRERSEGERKPQAKKKGPQIERVNAPATAKPSAAPAGDAAAPVTKKRRRRRRKRP